MQYTYTYRCTYNMYMYVHLLMYNVYCVQRFTASSVSEACFLWSKLYTVSILFIPGLNVFERSVHCFTTFFALFLSALSIMRFMIRSFSMRMRWATYFSCCFETKSEIDSTLQMGHSTRLGQALWHGGTCTCTISLFLLWVHILSCSSN